MVSCSLTSQTPELTRRKIAAFWLPLFSTWLMMGVEGPFIAAIIARLGSPTFNLAAFGVAFSLGMFFEAPIIMMLSATNALVKGRQTYLKLRRFNNALNLLITLAMLLVLLPPVFYWLTEGLIGMPPAVARLTRQATLLLIPWPAAIGYRRFYQGILIGNHLPHRVAYGTLVRLGSMAGTALLLYLFSSLPGACVGTAALAAGVVMEALASRVMAGPLVRKLLASPAADGAKPLHNRELAAFYFPLALTSLLGLAVHPMMAFFMGKSRLPIESLAVLPVVNSLTFVFRSAGLSFQEAAIALLKKGEEGYRSLRSFAWVLGSCGFGAPGRDRLFPGRDLVVPRRFRVVAGAGRAGRPAHPHLCRHTGAGGPAGLPARPPGGRPMHASDHQGHGDRGNGHRRGPAAGGVGKPAWSG